MRCSTRAKAGSIALDWIERNAKNDDWFLHVNYWDPHTPYRTPTEYGNPFEGEPIPEWYTEAIRRRHFDGYGPHSAQEPMPHWNRDRHPRVPAQIASMDDYRRWIDGYDVGIRYMDDHIGRLFDALKKQGVFEELVIIVSADHGESQGEFNVYGDHQTADQTVSRVPLVVRWPGVTSARVDTALHYQTDLSATVTELVGGECSPRWDGRSFAQAFRRGKSAGRDHLVLSQCAWSCQRTVRFDNYMMIRTYHDGLKDLPPYMLFDVDGDPHETIDLVEDHPELVDRAMRLLEDWHTRMMASSINGTDPLQTVLKEGGPFHARETHLNDYCKHLRETGRAHHAEALEARHGRS